MIYDNLHEISIGSKPLPIRIKKIDGFIRIHDGSRYLTLLGSEKDDTNYKRTRYLVSLKSSIRYFFLTVLRKSN